MARGDLPSPRVGRTNGAWLSLVERLVRDQEVAGSNPAAPINCGKGLRQ